MRKNNNGEGFCARVNCFAQETKIFQMWRIRLCFSRRCLIHVITSFVLAPPFDFTLCLASAGARVFYDDEDDDDNASEFNHQTRHCFHRQCVMFLLHKANHLVKGSRCRGGIVNIRCGCSRALLVPPSPKALWRFRASTSNSLSGRLGCILTRICVIYHTYAQQDIRVCGDDHFQPPKRQLLESQGALTSSRKYLRHSR